MPNPPQNGEYFITSYVSRPGEDLYNKSSGRALRADSQVNPNLMTSLPRSTRSGRVPRNVDALPGSAISPGIPNTEVNEPAEIYCYLPRVRLYPAQVIRTTGAFEPNMNDVHKELISYLTPTKSKTPQRPPLGLRQGRLLTDHSGRTFLVVSNSQVGSLRWSMSKARQIVSVVEVVIYATDFLDLPTSRMQPSADETVCYTSSSNSPVADVHLNTLDTVNLAFDGWSVDQRYATQSSHQVALFAQSLLRLVLDDLLVYLGIGVRS